VYWSRNNFSGFHDGFLLSAQLSQLT